jgi:hypothetical protein
VGRVELDPGERWSLCAVASGEGPSRDLRAHHQPVAIKMLMQIAVRDIGQLTDLELFSNEPPDQA